MTLGEEIRSYRHKNGISQGKLAKMLNVSIESVANWEKGFHKPDAFNQITLREKIGITLDQLQGE